MPKQRALKVASGVAALVVGASAMTVAMHTTHPPPQANLSSPGPITLEVADASDPVVAADPASAPEVPPEPAPEVLTPEPQTEAPAPAVVPSVTRTYAPEGDDGAPNPAYMFHGGSGACGGGLPPCWVKARESGGDYGAVNPSSGAGGGWQFLPSTWAGLDAGRGYARAEDAPPEVQDAAAAELWNGGAGCAAWQAC